MKSNFTKIATAAIVAIAFIIGMSFWKSTGSGITLAEVMEELERVMTYSYQTYSTEIGPQGRKERHAHVLISQNQGITVTLNKIDPNTGDIQPYETDYTSYNLDYVLCMVHETKEFYRVIFDDPNMFETLKGENHDPRIIVNELLMCEHVSLGKSVIEGFNVEGFQTRDPNYNGTFFAVSDIVGGTKQEVDVKLWVDAKTRLPVRLVKDIVKENGKEIHDVINDFRWNVLVTKEDFEPVIPEGYTSKIGNIVYPGINEEKAIKGLKAFADLVSSYPANPSDPTKEEAFLLATKLDESEFESLSKEDINRILNEILSPLEGLSMFHTKLIEENRDLAYYGETIKPGETTKVLLRWKVSENEYRVIFGDLSARTVTPEELTELEQNLPK